MPRSTLCWSLTAEAYPFTKGWNLNFLEVMRTDERAAEALKSDKPQWKRNMVRTAILLAYPEKA